MEPGSFMPFGQSPVISLLFTASAVSLTTSVVVGDGNQSTRCQDPICRVGEYCERLLPPCVRFCETTSRVDWMNITVDRLIGIPSKTGVWDLGSFVERGSCSMKVTVVDGPVHGISSCLGVLHKEDTGSSVCVRRFESFETLQDYVASKKAKDVVLVEVELDENSLGGDYKTNIDDESLVKLPVDSTRSGENDTSQISGRTIDTPEEDVQRLDFVSGYPFTLRGQSLNSAENVYWLPHNRRIRIFIPARKTERSLLFDVTDGDIVNHYRLTAGPNREDQAEFRTQLTNSSGSLLQILDRIYDRTHGSVIIHDINPIKQSVLWSFMIPADCSETSLSDTNSKTTRLSMKCFTSTAVNPVISPEIIEIVTVVLGVLLIYLVILSVKRCLDFHSKPKK